ncbi:MAG: hypothetical protein GF364_20600 [Candidatus Lokiarchaeota archaeon]|nr:hypothetical protein [Candidatus Lokiarchaeota archaeon]
MKRKLDQKKKAAILPRGSLLFWMILVITFWIVWSFLDPQDRSQNFSIATYWLGRWRMGQNAIDTIWDPYVFHGHIWFNLFIIIIIVGFWLYRAPPWRNGIYKPNKKKLKAISITSAIVALSMIIAMNITMFMPRFIWTNWYPTQTTYFLPTLPALIAGMALLVAPMRKYVLHKQSKKKNQELTREKGRKEKIILITIILSIIPWLFMTIPTTWHPHGFFHLQIQVHYFLFTFSVPMVGSVLIATKMLKKPPTKGDGKYARKEFIALILGLLLLVVIDLIPMFIEERLRGRGIFHIDIYFWWIYTMWPSWVFIIASSVAIISGMHLYYVNQMKMDQKSVENVKNHTPISKLSTGSRARSPTASSIQVGPKGILVILIIFAFVIPPIQGIRDWQNSQDPNMILINQVGYLPQSPKRIAFQMSEGVEAPNNATFWIVNASSNEVKYEGTLYKNATKYGHAYMLSNFTDFTDTGKYHCIAEVDDINYTSYDFEIGPHVYNIIRERAVDFFYYQRSGYDIEEVVDGFPGSPAGNLDDAMVWNGTGDDGLPRLVWKNLTGGWHDAGDYNKYNGWYQTQWFCTHALANAWQLDNVSFWNSRKNVVDSPAPDVIDEMLWGAAFMMKMVDTSDIRGIGEHGLVFDTISGWNYNENRESRMGYWGPPHLYTTPEIDGDERVCGPSDSKEAHEPGGWRDEVPWGFVTSDRGYQYAGTLLQVARLLEDYQTLNPSYTPPKWGVDFELNVTNLRYVADLINESYAPRVSKTYETTGVEHAIGELIYHREIANLTGDWETFDKWANATLDELIEKGCLYNQAHFMNDHAFAIILESYLENGRPIPDHIINNITIKQNQYYKQWWPQDAIFPVMKYNDTDTPELNLFRQGGWELNPPDEGNTVPIMASYLHALISAILPETKRIDIIQGQLDYILGFNPLNLCQMSGVGDKNVPQLHHRRQWIDWPSGHVPGGIINGIKKEQPNRDYIPWQQYPTDSWWMYGPDQPMVDTWQPSLMIYDGVSCGSQEIWIPHNAAWLFLTSTIFKYNLI